MLVGLLVVLQLVSASLVHTASESNIMMLLPGDIQKFIFGMLKVRDLESVNYVSIGLNTLATRFFLDHYGSCYNGKTCLDFSKMAARLETLVKDAGAKHGLQEALEVLVSSQEYANLKSFLEADFGECIAHSPPHLPKFELSSNLLGILKDSYRISILPYVLDNHSHGSSQWVDLIEGLLKQGRGDLLDRMCFPNISLKDLGRLIAVGAPQALIDRILALPRAQPFSQEDVETMALAGYGNPSGQFASDCMIPLWVLWRSQKSGLSMPGGLRFCGGLAEESIPFWKSLFKNDRRDMLEVMQQRGDESIKVVLRSFEEFNVIRGVEFKERDVYHAILVYMRSSRMANQHVVGNFDTTVQQGLFEINSLRAAFDCKQYDLLTPMGDVGTVPRPSGIVNLIDIVCQAGKVDLILRVAQQGLQSLDLAAYAKKLVLLKTNDDSYVQIVLAALAAIKGWYHPSHCFSAPLAALRRLASGQEFSSINVGEMLHGTKGYRCDGKEISPELHIVHTLMFWGASEAVLTRHIERLEDLETISGQFSGHVWLCSKYSDEFIRTNAKRFNMFLESDPTKFYLFRYDLATEIFGAKASPLT